MSQQISIETVFSQVRQSLSAKKYYSALQQLSSISLTCSKEEKFLMYLAETQQAIKDYQGLIKTQRELVRQRGAITDQIQLMKGYYLLNQRNEALDIGLQLQNQQLSDLQEHELSHLLVKIYLEENDFEGASEVILKSQFSEADDFLLWAQGIIFLNNDQKAKALEYFRRSVQLNAKNDRAWVSLALMHKEMGDEDLFLANLEKAMDLNPYNVLALKLFSQSVRKNSNKMNSAFERVQFYLSEHCFDEDMSLCHIHMLCHSKQWRFAELELEKLMLNEPGNEDFKIMKKSMCEARIL